MQPAIQYNDRVVSVSYPSITALIRANEKSGLHFFKPDTMDFFDSTIESQIIGGGLFITGERPPKRARTPEWEKRRYTIRAADSDGGVFTVGGFGEFATRAKARRVAQRIAESLAGEGVAIYGAHRLKKNI